MGPPRATQMIALILRAQIILSLTKSLSLSNGPKALSLLNGTESLTEVENPELHGALSTVENPEFIEWAEGWNGLALPLHSNAKRNGLASPHTHLPMTERDLSESLTGE